VSQVFAIARLRLRILINTLRHKASGWETVAGFFAAGASLLLSLGLAALLGAMTSAIVKPEDPKTLTKALYLCFWACTVFGLLMPLLLSTGAGGIDTSRLIGYPISRRRLFFISWGSAFVSPDHIFYYPALLVTLVAVAWIQPEFGATSVAFFLTVPLMVVTWSVGVLTLLQGLMRHRRGKEILTMAGFGLLISVALLPGFLSSTLETERDATEAMLEGYGQAIGAVAAFAPPSVTASGIVAAHAGDTAAVGRAFLLLGAWLLAGFAAAGAAFRWSLRGAGLGSTTPGGSDPRRLTLPVLEQLLPFLPADVRAIASKEVLYLMRSSVGRFNLLLAPIVCAMMLTVFGSVTGNFDLKFMSADSATLYGLMIYALLFNNNFVSNAVGWEGPGFKLYLLAPVPFERVLLGKNLGVWIYSAGLYSLVIGTWLLLRGMPGLEDLVGSALIFAGAMLLFTAEGNFASLAFPVVRDISAMKSQPSQAATLLSILTALSLGAIILFIVMVPWILGIPTGTLPPLLLFVLLAAIGYRLSLRPAAELFRRNRQKIVAKLELGA
jgi:ABC-2 type transport system permease protein